MIYKEFVLSIQQITTYYKILVEETKNKKTVGSTNEWILDNYFIISEQEKSIRDELRSKVIKSIKSKRKKLLYELLDAILYKSNYQIDINLIFNEINEYQQKQNDYFSYTEISFLYILFRIILIQKISNLSQHLQIKLHAKIEAENFFNNLKKEELSTNDLTSQIKQILQNESYLKNPFFLDQLNNLFNSINNIPEILHLHFKEIFIKSHKILQQQMDESAANNILITNLFISLKKMTKFEISEFYSHISFTENILINEKVGMYNQMYDNNKDNYRAKIIRDAKKLHISEYQYAIQVVEQANKINQHVGWTLFTPKKYRERSYAYISIVAFFTIILSFLLSLYMGPFAFLLLLVPISQFVIELFNQLLQYLHKPNSTLKLKFENSIPKEYATMVIIPTIIKTKEKIDQMFDKLEVYYLSNFSDNLYFTLLGDCSSETSKYSDVDTELIATGLKKVKELNEKYNKNIFNFVYRQRFYSESEGCFLGFERKRGAILHFNDLLLGNLSEEKKKELFQCQTLDNFDISISYIITLDTDTQLVLYSAFQLIGAIAHPMNQPVLSQDGKHVVSGYAIMQPRVNVDIDVTNKSRYAQLFSGLGGLDVYTTASYELYQDTFNEGSFVGKGIYNLKIFQQILSGTFPQNLILSHDLLEGNYLRCGLINDVILFDDSPSNYLDDAKRHHRWVRGDWQIIQWLKKNVKNEKGETVRNPINTLGKWKIFDNLRRSVMSMSLLILLFFGFTFGKHNPLIYLMVVLIVVSTPILFYLLSRIIFKRKYSRYLRYYMTLARGIAVVINKSLIVLSILPKEAFMYFDAIVRALYRMFISKKNLLNWITSEDAEKMTKNTLKSYIRNFRVNFVFALLFIAGTWYFKTEETSLYLMVAILIACLWCLAPFRMYWLGKKIKTDEKHLQEKQLEEIKEIAFRTWNYFHTLLHEETNFLIPDNYQLSRTQKTDYKTSPTNIGYSMLSVISAYELGFISLKEASYFLEKIIETVTKLKKWEGHLFNWYNIYSLEELNPYFVSSADSGNFVACLYVVKGFLKKIDNKILLNNVLRLIDNTNFSKLYNKDLDVFSIGFDYRDQHLLPYHYNNFASEARLTSFIAISKGDAPYKHWFCLDKTLTKYKFYKGVASWYGTLFEYFMPLIFMKTFKHTLMDETYAFAYYAQKEFMKEIDKNLPWGISESGYNELDDAQNYKYKAFGVPYLKFQNTISNRIVISPYSSLMVISTKDKEVYENIQKFKQLNMYSEFGFFESYDEEDKVNVEAHYAHHQGMILASLTNYLKSNCIQNYFHQDKKIQSMETLLKEKAQIKPYIDLKISKYKRFKYPKERQENDIREYDNLSPIPEIGVLSNGYYTLLINDRGCGFSRYKDIYINRYRKITAENYGIFMYIRDIYSGKIWSNTYAPLNVKPDKYRVIFASDRIKYIREDSGIITTTEMCVVKDKNAEIRKISFENQTSKDVVLELTSYGEVIMCQNDRDIAHRSFNSMTIYSEFDEQSSTLIFTRKSRHNKDTKYYVASRMFFDNENDLKIEYETSRLHFIGRNNTTGNPNVIINRGNLSKGLGSSLDPIMSIRREIIVRAGQKESIFLSVAFGKSREQVLDIVNGFRNNFDVTVAFEMATALNNMRTGYSQLKGVQMRLYNTILKHIFQTSSNSESRKSILRKNTLDQTNLWKFSISGDLPIILIEIDAIENALILKDVLQAYEFYKSRGVYVDIVIINNEKESNEELLKKYISDLVNKIYYFNYFENSSGNVHTLSSSELSEEEKTLLYTIARISINTSSGKSLEKQMQELETDLFSCADDCKYTALLTKDIKHPKNLMFYNEFGGFIDNGNEYYITNINTPMPWINVIANPDFGFIISGWMSGFTYAYNSQAYKISSWSNDMVGDPPSELILINKQRFIPTAARHGFGYSLFMANSYAFNIQIKVFASLQDKIKYYLINIENIIPSDQNIQLSLITKLVLGVTEEKTNRHLLSNWSEEDNCLYFTNVYNHSFKNTHVYLSSTEKLICYNDSNPNQKCIETQVYIQEGETKQMAFIIGVKDINTPITHIQLSTVEKEFHKVTNFWKEKLSAIKVNTPDTSFNYVMNNWYLYQTYAARLFARAGFYQVGGAYGFRDQLQDTMSIMYSDALIARNQIIKHASHQFLEGDVLHWWHEELSFGSRTTFSDDYLWLVYVSYEYILMTGDYSILDEAIPFVQGEKLKEGETEKGIHFYFTKEKQSLYEHLKLCINKSLNQFGKHGLPLMGSGDWNDGMNKIGNLGKGESVWVGFFLLDILHKTIHLSTYKQDEDFVNQCKKTIPDFTQSLINNAWDGEWFLRAYFDNGETLGSRNNLECQIDLLSQSWSLLTDVADEDKKQRILRETENRLVDHENKIIKLLTPAFKNSKNNPGYIMDYLEGIRENGGQYTHGAMWYIMALLKEGYIDKAYSYYSMINPINRTSNIGDTIKYKVEPYSIAADIYSNPQSAGRGGWTWYTGSSSWAYKVGLEHILGFRKKGDTLTFEPKIPSSWKSFQMEYRYFDTLYHIEVLRMKEEYESTFVSSIILDDKLLKNKLIPLINDKKEHSIKVIC
ncbi:MAG: hypothetical protein KBA86_00405 [Bacteroidales bacterium]|mgnify:CR=1 FL=1|nr:hypothetical protein [Bacteroidales bacterium]